MNLNIDWDEFRYLNGMINLEKLYRNIRGIPTPEPTPPRIKRFLYLAESVRGINSRQVAAAIMANAVQLEGEV